jgi:hypothetical protein
MQRGAARAVRVLHDHIAAMQAVIPRAPALRLRETFMMKSFNSMPLTLRSTMLAMCGEGEEYE